jgi:hypothetical protein
MILQTLPLRPLLQILLNLYLLARARHLLLFLALVHLTLTDFIEDGESQEEELFEAEFESGEFEDGEQPEESEELSEQEGS